MAVTIVPNIGEEYDLPYVVYMPIGEVHFGFIKPWLDENGTGYCTWNKMSHQKLRQFNFHFSDENTACLFKMAFG